MRLDVKVVEEGECLKSWISFGGVRVVYYITLDQKALRTWKLEMASKALYYYDSK
jgi:hypothetical protein